MVTRRAVEHGREVQLAFKTCPSLRDLEGEREPEPCEAFLMLQENNLQSGSDPASKQPRDWRNCLSYDKKNHISHLGMLLVLFTKSPERNLRLNCALTETSK